MGQAAVAAAGRLSAAAQRDTLVFGFPEPVCIFPVGVIVDPTTVQLLEKGVQMLLLTKCT